MHYRNGRAAFNGDPVIGKSYNGVFAGTLHSVNPGATSCNGQVAVPVPGGFRTECVTIGELYHAECAFRIAEGIFNKPKPVEPTKEAEPTETKQVDTAAAPVAAEA
jgi:hypothetical protein